MQGMSLVLFDPVGPNKSVVVGIYMERVYPGIGGRLLTCAKCLCVCVF